MNIGRIENNKLRNFMERHPDATFKNIVEFCRQEFEAAITELTSSLTRDLQRALDNDELRGSSRKLQDIMEPAVRHTRNIRHYITLQDSAIYQMNDFVGEVDAIADSHTESFINSLRDVIEGEFDEISMITPSSRTDLDSVYSFNDRKMSRRKDTQDLDDRKMVADLSDRVLQAKRSIYNQFNELSTEDFKLYGIVYERGRGAFQDRDIVDRIAKKKDDLIKVFNSSSQFFKDDITHALSQNNEIAFQEIQDVIKSCRSIINEAVYQISREEKEEELRREDQRRVDIDNKMKAEEREFEARREAHKKEEQQFQERAKKKEEQGIESASASPEQLEAFDDIANIRMSYDKDNVLFTPSNETYMKLAEAGMSIDDIPKYIWDRFVRTTDADEKLRFGEITQEAYDKELETIQKIEEIIFSELVAGVEFDEARTTAEDVALHGKEYTPKSKEEISDFTYSFDNILISASAETREILVNAGVPENYVDAYVWDRFVRGSNLDSNLEKGKISKAEYDEKSEMIERIEELLFDGLVEGKTIEEARAMAENRAALEAAVSIVPSPEAQQELEAAGLSTENAKKYVWDRFVRVQLIDEALEKGQITEEEREQQLAQVDSIEKALVDGLRAGNSFAEARRNAETGNKSALQDISGDTSITTSKVNDANNFIQAETKNKFLDTDLII